MSAYKTAPDTAIFPLTAISNPIAFDGLTRNLCNVVMQMLKKIRHDVKFSDISTPEHADSFTLKPPGQKKGIHPENNSE